ncbi:N-acetylglucosaminyl deacetylase, LmbE family [Streptoalloteichus tenebrarius]|uniref:N-acetylglucosaminyl deacetylase, LmbE family n=1 Tax=Streptoalloteichus tenebrarius (strain ATCC 17920 / DSM 40477 / JCM 4838 / CBS 697.72 / NBRC 16177 / NCIMB 11028 / NRRL B-12390 / A12253. 1 / ISP 5477) TaxID=1933 RepID=A0ABT1I2P6_STRSD|nr:PIG-L deacetylase family protein [Streptoalloteichus tenebrarius]MCP2262056.1 N-acetylglucosaminyl deacetylase, LmbE family [Streptoalloteichus tenebrarius]BFF01304.1 PIG-L family deacetylase [Streptoalloteichus tenebrarius]
MELAEFPEDWSSALVVVAHPDDMEYGGAAAVARWTAQGKKVVYLLASRGEAGIDGMAPDECAEVRVREQVASAAEVGVDVVEFLDHPDGMIEYGLPLRRDVARAIRRHRPEVVLVVNHRETYGGTFLNMADHRAVGQAGIDAVRDAANRWVFRELADEGLEPWDGVRHLAVIASPDATHAVDVTESFEAGVRSLLHHRAYLDGLGPDWPKPEVFLRQGAEQVAERFGGRLGVSFEML